MKRKQIISPNYSFLHGPELLGAMNGEVPSLVKGKGGICGWDSEEVCIHHATWIQPELNEAPLNPAMAGEDWNISCHINKQRCHQLSSVAQSCPTLCDPMNRSMPGLLVHHHLPEFTQTHVHRVHDAIQPSQPRPSPSPPAPNPSQHQSLFQWVKSSHEVAKVLELQL